MRSRSSLTVHRSPQGVACCCQAEDGGKFMNLENEEITPWGKKKPKPKKAEVVEVDSDATTDDEAPPPTPKSPPKKKGKEKRAPKPKPPMISSQRGPLSKSKTPSTPMDTRDDDNITPNDEEEEVVQPLAKPEKDLMTLTNPDGFLIAAPLERSAFRRPGVSNSNTTTVNKR
ncbi:hypothetical protein TL16_g04195 [Triparma laevis f. inornata]|uniref:Uncharacterized protein n=1 Tax=Triparma laevis f. inornata TaxID=1714386 RepID=A0A9W7ACU4_9STRA|nr:hypothetical protein TL16_g04195 [Triparma laevis f. inornata]